ncbi:hypothetical protein AB4Y64_09690 [Lysobacter sp. TAF61]|uniref:hypothetical protein n=1 Tax=Lysobacter sp. TAF61 TaxID=3233072 RepID=UPI003F9E7DB5
MSLDYARALETTPADERRSWPELRAWRLPMCWLRGHRWPGTSFSITAYTLEWCECCGEEVAGRTSWAQLEARPIDLDELPWFGFEDLDR